MGSERLIDSTVVIPPIVFSVSAATSGPVLPLSRGQLAALEVHLDELAAVGVWATEMIEHDDFDSSWLALNLRDRAAQVTRVICWWMGSGGMSMGTRRWISAESEKVNSLRDELAVQVAA